MPFRLSRRAPDPTSRLPLDDEGASWIRTHRLPFQDYSVGGLVPVAFESNVRLLHPAHAASGAAVRWDVVAGWSGRTIHALAQWEFLSRPTAVEVSGPPFAEPPATGGLPPAELATLLEVLDNHTRTPDRCFIGVWEGFGWLHSVKSDWGAELALDQRTFLIRQSSIGGASRVGWHSPNGEFAQEPPTLIWPADRAWFVASDVDLDSTYVGGAAALATALIDHPYLEAWPVEPGDDISIRSDSINAL